MTLYDTALTEYLRAVEAYADARATEDQLEHERVFAKQDALLRILTTENPLTSKQHSATSAESVVGTDPEYAAYLGRQRQAVVNRIKADGLREAARLTLQHLALDPTP